MKFDDEGVCSACRYYEYKKTVDWDRKKEELKETLEKYRNKNGSKYDCIIPVSGGKDSTYQTHLIKNVFKMNPLLVTFNHEWMTSVGVYNRDNLPRQFNVDHIMFTPNPEVVRRISKVSMREMGDPCWHCHSGIFSFILRAVVHYKIPLVVYGENYVLETGMDVGNAGMVEDKEYIIDKEMKGITIENFIGKEGLTKSDLKSYELPSDEELDEVGMVGLFLGDCIDWDAKEQVKFIKKEFEWRGAEYGKEDDGYIAPPGPHCEGCYEDYENIECKMPGIHDYLKFLKMGYGRATDQAAMDVRRGLMTREEALKIAEEYDTKRPPFLDWTLDYVEMPEDEFYEIAFSMRDKRIDESKDGIWKARPDICERLSR